jgi:hypothetical protein
LGASTCGLGCSGLGIPVVLRLDISAPCQKENSPAKQRGSASNKFAPCPIRKHLFKDRAQS